jgi:hypothetical protein
LTTPETIRAEKAGREAQCRVLLEQALQQTNCALTPKMVIAPNQLPQVMCEITALDPQGGVVGNGTSAPKPKVLRRKAKQ